MEKLRQNKILIVLIVFGAFMVIFGLCFLLGQDSPEISTTNMTVTEIVGDEALKAELEALKSKFSTMAQELSSLLLERKIMVAEQSRLLAEVAQLRANQQPNLASEYTMLKRRYEKQYSELSKLKSAYDTLLAQHQELLRKYDLCVEKNLLLNLGCWYNPLKKGGLNLCLTLFLTWQHSLLVLYLPSQLRFCIPTCEMPSISIATQGRLNGVKCEGGL